MDTFSHNYRGTSAHIEKQVIHLDNDSALKSIFREGRGALFDLSDDLSKEHEKYFSEKLKISTASLACEIYMHVLVGGIAAALPKAFQKNRIVKRAIRSTEVIDCGAKAQDGNRWCWDLLAHFMVKPKK